MATNRLSDLLQSTAQPFSSLGDAIADNIKPLLPSKHERASSHSFRLPSPLLLSARSWRAALIGVASDISPGSVPAPSSTAMADRCRLCRARLPGDHLRRHWRICGPGGTYCNHFESDAEIKSHYGSRQYSGFVRAGVKERWRRPVRRPLAAQPSPHFVHLTGLLADTTASNLHLFEGCHRVNVLFDELRELFPAEEVRLRSFFHVRGDSEAIISFDDKAVAKQFVAVVNQGG